MILSGVEIREAMLLAKHWKICHENVEGDVVGMRATEALWKDRPRIVIDPLDDDSMIGPNSVDLTLGPKLRVYTDRHLDPIADNPTRLVPIPPDGKLLEPGDIYLGRTAQWTESFNCVPMMEGRSSLARLGLSIHATGGFGDVGFCGTWTLEMSCIKPVMIRAGMPIAQIYYLTVSPEHENYGDRKRSKYQGQHGVTPCRIYQEITGHK